MSNFGILQLRVVNVYNVAFREARSAVAAAPLLQSAEEFQSLSEAVADCNFVVGTTAARDREVQVPLVPLADAALEIRARATTGRVAIVFGSEKHGLSNEDMSHCHTLMRIPTRDEHSSMNLGQAVAISLYEVVREAGSLPTPNVEASATSGDLERMTSLLEEALVQSGYVKPGAEDSTKEKVRRLIYRTGVTHDDAQLWLGMLRQILWKLRNH